MHEMISTHSLISMIRRASGGMLEGLRRDWRDVGGPPEGLEGLWRDVGGPPEGLEGC